MDHLTFRLEKFEGPLDLLLFLISNHKLDIYDIEISALLEQYLDFIDGLDEQDLELAGEFLEMAARLIYIKTVSLLPKPNEAEELKRELQGTLIEYSVCKQAALRLKEAYAGSEIFVRRPMTIPADKSYGRLHSPELLAEAYMGISARSRNDRPLSSSVFRPLVSRKIVSVGSKVVYILRRLYTVGEYDMDKLFDGLAGRSERIATFLAVLELAKGGRITISDDNKRVFMQKKPKTRSYKTVEG